MKIFNDTYEKINNNDEITLTIGNFDGLHLGHQRLLQTANSFNDTKSAVMTFTPHPISVISGVTIPNLTTDDQKTALIENQGIDILFAIEFTKSFARLDVEEFIDFLKQLSVKRIVVGRDFRFAHKGSGNIDDLKKHFEVIVLPDLLYKETRISSSFIKQLLDYGKVEEVKELLDRFYRLSGTVVDGDKVGRTLGYPTANIEYLNAYLPKNGIYYVKVYLKGHVYDGLLNIGHNPTVNYSSKRRAEVFIFDFNEDIYGKNIAVDLIKYLRDEMKFDTIDALLEQMENDVINAKKIISVI